MNHIYIQKDQASVWGQGGTPNLPAAGAVIAPHSALSAQVDAVVAPPSVSAPARSGPPLLDPPVAARLNSSETLEAPAMANAELNALLSRLMESVDFKQIMALKNSETLMEKVIETVTKGLEYRSGIEKMQAEVLMALRNKAVEQAAKAAEAGILEKIFGWIGRVFALIALTLSTVALYASGQIALGVLTTVALAFMVMDFASAISQECGGPDISLAGCVALIVEAGGVGEDTLNAIRQWLGLVIQIFTAVMGVVGGGAAAAGTAVSATAKTSLEIATKWANTVLSLVSGANTIASSGTGIATAVERKKLADAEVAVMTGQSFHELLIEITKRWAEDLQGFRDHLDEKLQLHSSMLNKEHELNTKIAVA